MFLMLKLLQILLEDQNLDYFILPIHVLHYAYVLNYYINRMIRKKHRSKAKKVPLFVSFSENLSTKGFFVRLCVEDYT